LYGEGQLEFQDGWRRNLGSRSVKVTDVSTCKTSLFSCFIIIIIKTYLCRITTSVIKKLLSTWVLRMYVFKYEFNYPTSRHLFKIPGNSGLFCSLFYVCSLYGNVRSPERGQGGRGVDFTSQRFERCNLKP